jgi:hypothetical protein
MSRPRVDDVDTRLHRTARGRGGQHPLAVIGELAAGQVEFEQHFSDTAKAAEHELDVPLWPADHEGHSVRTPRDKQPGVLIRDERREASSVVPGFVVPISARVSNNTRAREQICT